MSAGTALDSRRVRAIEVVRKAYADRRGAEGVILRWLLTTTDGADAVAVAEYVSGVREGFREAQVAAQWRRTALRTLAEGVRP